MFVTDQPAGGRWRPESNNDAGAGRQWRPHSRDRRRAAGEEDEPQIEPDQSPDVLLPGYLPRRLDATEKALVLPDQRPGSLGARHVHVSQREVVDNATQTDPTEQPRESTSRSEKVAQGVFVAVERRVEEPGKPPGIPADGLPTVAIVPVVVV